VLCRKYDEWRKKMVYPPARSHLHIQFMAAHIWKVRFCLTEDETMSEMFQDILLCFEDFGQRHEPVFGANAGSRSSGGVASMDFETAKFWHECCSFRLHVFDNLNDGDTENTTKA